MQNFKMIVEKHEDGYIAYPLGLKGAVLGQGDSYEEALTDVKSAIKFHIETFGDEADAQNHSTIKASTLRSICTQVGISRKDFIKTYNKT